MGIKKSDSLKGVTKSTKNLTPEGGDTIKRAVDFLIDVIVILTNKGKNKGL